MDIKLIDYSETSGSRSGEKHKDTSSIRIAVAPVQQPKSHAASENPSESTVDIKSTQILSGLPLNPLKRLMKTF